LGQPQGNGTFGCEGFIIGEVLQGSLQQAIATMAVKMTQPQPMPIMLDPQ